MDSYLAHYGVLGMKWGVRRYQNTDGSLKKAGKKRQRDNKKNYDIPEEKGGHRVRLEAEYLKKGYSDNDAEQLAAKRIKGEKYVATGLGLAVAAGVSYTAYREIGKRYSKVVLEAGSDLHYINALGSKSDYDRRLYTTFEKRDTAKYKGLFATALRTHSKDTTIYDTVLRTTEKIKAPSQKEAAKMYKEFLNNNPDIKPTPYHIMNRNIVKTINEKYGEQGTSRQFMDYLKTKGYNAILDSNDQFFSGYNVKKPVILFNAASSTVKVGETIVDKQLSDKLNKYQMSNIRAKEMAQSVGLGATVVSIKKGLNTKTKYGAVNSYIHKNPDTDLSYGAIYNALENNYKGEYVVNKTKLKG